MNRVVELLRSADLELLSRKCAAIWARRDALPAAGEAGLQAGQENLTGEQDRPIRSATADPTMRNERLKHPVRAGELQEGISDFQDRCNQHRLIAALCLQSPRWNRPRLLALEVAAWEYFYKLSKEMGCDVRARCAAARSQLWHHGFLRTWPH